MRILNSKEKIDYKDTRDFFEKRAEKYRSDNPYSVTMYQDNHPEIVLQRNKKEVEKLLPLLELDKNSRVLDIACGIGRWSDAIATEIAQYTGIDFSQKLIEIARQRNNHENRIFLQGESTNISSILRCDPPTFYNRILLIGALVYINDEDLKNTFNQICEVCAPDSVICIREPIGIDERLTIKQHFSDDLKDYYNAIYRTRDECISFFETTLMRNGFKITKEGWLFEEPELNNRKETAQYYFILKN